MGEVGEEKSGGTDITVALHSKVGILGEVHGRWTMLSLAN